MTLYLRSVVEEDRDILYQWANDPEVRNNAFHTEQINYDTHKLWFANVLKDKDVLQYILVSEDGEKKEKKKMGQIRLNIYQDRAVIDYSIARDMRKKGLGVKIIQLMEQKLHETGSNISILVAEVKNENVASAKVFEKCGYVENRKKEYIEYTKYLK